MFNRNTPLTGRASLIPNKAIWRFLAVPVSAPDVSPIVLQVIASSEQEARDSNPGWLLFFAARLPAQEVRHGA
ncbi:host cell division inhibitor Icd-like protein [Edwardsiella tarda]|uniref:host cell division inhibitor Icd-like protein n=1 Tax=Edwardsiella tarda TaxID=636 RepID=UPI000941FED0|nr:host cell division inhibitor Icd-like protein [Edwardsiella tarda]